MCRKQLLHILQQFKNCVQRKGWNVQLLCDMEIHRVENLPLNHLFAGLLIYCHLGQPYVYRVISRV